MRRQLPGLMLTLVVATWPCLSCAQTVVYDPTAVGRLIQQYQTTLQQLQQLRTQVQQGQTLLTSLNVGSQVNALAAQLSSPALRSALPDAQALMAAGGGDLSRLGPLGAAASALRTANRVYTPPSGDAAGQDLAAEGDRAALAGALGKQVADVSAQRLQGLQTLQGAIGAGDARAALDLQARLQAEQTMLVNEQLRLQGLAMAQAAQDRLERQRERERAAQSHAEAQAAFRSMIR